MSGICAVWSRQHPGTAETLTAMTSALSLHRTERSSQESRPGIGIAVSARFSAQQIYADDRLVLACDAEVVNEAELRDIAGQPKDGNVATLLAALYSRLGCGFVEKLRGGFSVVLWDARARQLVGAIDGFGIKRLVYAVTPQRTTIASRIDAIARS